MGLPTKLKNLTKLRENLTLAKMVASVRTTGRDGPVATAIGMGDGEENFVTENAKEVGYPAPTTKNAAAETARGRVRERPDVKKKKTYMDVGNKPDPLITDAPVKEEAVRWKQIHRNQRINRPSE